jgi:probable rRNA maturation factor
MINIDLDVEDEAWRVIGDLEALVQSAIGGALEEGAPGLEDAALDVLLTDDATVADLNQRFRGKAGPTNVLSFPAPVTARPHLGDLSLAYGVCAREAIEQKKSFAHHLQHLLVHGALHLVGFDHMSEAEAESMEALERKVLATLGVPNPYLVHDDEDHGQS